MKKWRLFFIFIILSLSFSLFTPPLFLVFLPPVHARRRSAPSSAGSCAPSPSSSFPFRAPRALAALEALLQLHPVRFEMSCFPAFSNNFSFALHPKVVQLDLFWFPDIWNFFKAVVL